MIAFAFITISIFSIVAHYLEKDAKKTFMGVHNVLSAADSMSVTYQHHNLNLYDIYFVRDKELYEKIKSLIITPEYKLRALWFGGFRESMYFNVGNREHKKLGSTFFDICPEAGLELYGDTFFLRFEAADKHLFSKIHKTLKQSGCLLPPMPRKNSRREPNDPQ